MTKLIVTHHHPDLDAIMASWLLVRFDQPQYGDSSFAFVPAPTTYKNQPVDSDEKIVHVDVGAGKFDHHKLGGFVTCAAKLVWEELVAESKIEPSDQPLKEMIEVAYEIDTFKDYYWQDTDKPRMAFMLHEIIPALHRLQIYDNEAVMRLGFSYLDGVYQRLKDNEKGKEAVMEGVEFESKWGKGIVVKTAADDVSKIAQKMGYEIVVIEDAQHGYLKIKTAPGVKLSLQTLYDKIGERESQSRWVYHNSGHMLFSGSDKGEQKEPTQLKLSDILEMIENENRLR
ncbi:MAG: hypothetical protein UX64_C0020G0006 [Microgenomates group bacterium GW2011_GWC2_46_7]|nr:MAG: hypothetical protein UX64_C0020G0006 [Microgenomates group bacterium GW2011_GWC2_46_7]